MHAQGAESGNAIVARLEQPSTLKLAKKNGHETTLRQLIKGLKVFRDFGGWSKDPSSWVRLLSYSGWSTWAVDEQEHGDVHATTLRSLCGDYREKASLV